MKKFLAYLINFTIGILLLICLAIAVPITIICIPFIAIYCWIVGEKPYIRINYSVGDTDDE